MKIAIDKIKNNPDNPRTIKDDAFKKLVQSIKDFPEMAEAREIIVNKDYVILGGNMRFRAMKEAGWQEVPVKIVDWPEEKQKEFIIKDNVSGGEWDWDLLANEWNIEDFEQWGLEVPFEWKANVNDYGEEFALDSESKQPFQQMTFILADEQAEFIKDSIDKIKNKNGETFGNQNKNGNALYWAIEEWVEQKI